MPVTHDDIFGDYTCEAYNKMGKLTRQVKLSEGAKAGIPLMEIHKINTEGVIMTVLVIKLIKLSDFFHIFDDFVHLSFRKISNRN